jgi:dimethylamine/trimethylamine dehydrogenase
MGFRMPKSLAAMRETKVESGWGVVCTEYCSIHPSSDDLPLPSASLWDEEGTSRTSSRAPSAR